MIDRLPRSVRECWDVDHALDVARRNARHYRLSWRGYLAALDYQLDWLGVRP